MAALDIILIVVMLYAIVRGFMKGFVMTLASLFGIFISLFVAGKYGQTICSLILSKTDWTDEVNYYVSFIVVFLIMMLLVRYLAIMVTKLFHLMMIGWLDKLLGAFLGWVKCLAILSCMLYSFGRLNDHVHILSTEYLNSCTLYEPIKNLSHYVFQVLRDVRENTEINAVEKSLDA